MKWYWVKTHRLIKKLLPSYIWDMPGNAVYLTFDDGPTPEVTDFVLEQLELHNAKATFFCIGKNVSAHPEIFSRITNAGHDIGNHTHDHLNGWQVSTPKYLQNVTECEVALGDTNLHRLFRPPYGKLTRTQLRALKAIGYKIIMWDVLSADFDTRVCPDKCVNNVLRNIGPGSIVIFHDSEKAAPNLRHALPATLEYLKEKGLRAEALSRSVPAPAQ